MAKIGVENLLYGILTEAADGTPKKAAAIGEADKQVIGNPTPDFTM